MMTLVLAGIAAAGTTWWLVRRGPHRQALVLYGNVDLRQVELAFNNNERIAAVLVQEGDRVKRGQLLARLDARPAGAAGRRGRGHRRRTASGRRKIAQWQPPARDRGSSGECRLGRAAELNARGQYERRKMLAVNSIVSQQDLENAKAALDVAEAKLAVVRRYSTWPLPDRARKTSVRPRPSYAPTRRRRLSCARNSPMPSSSPRWMPSSARD